MLKEAYKAFRRKRYQEAIVLFERIIITDKNPSTLFLMAVSCLKVNKFKDADITIGKLDKVNPDYTPLIRLKCFLFLKSSSTKEQAISFYLEQLEKIPGDRLMNRTLKKLYNSVNFNVLQKKIRLEECVSIPAPEFVTGKNRKYLESAEKGHAVKPLKFILTICSALVVCGIIFCLFYYFPIISKKIKPREAIVSKSSSAIDNVNLDYNNYSLIDKIKIKTTPEFYYSDNLLKDDFNEIKLLLKSEKYNQALLLINKIKNSNANYRVQEKIDFFSRFVAAIEHRDFENFDMKMIQKSPYIYDNILLKCRGRITNLKKERSKTTFTLLVDYEDNDKFSGITDIYYDKENFSFSNGEFVAVSGIFKYIPGSDKSLILAKSVVKEKQ